MTGGPKIHPWLAAHQPAIAALADSPDRPLWSVMIPSFNCATLLEETLSSVLAQAPDAATMQIEVVDDCSTADDPEAVVQRMGKGRVSFYRQPANVGHVRNFNTCLQRSRGRLVHVLHGDDWVADGFYDRMGALFERLPEIGAGFCRHTTTDTGGAAKWVSPLERPDPGVLDGWLETVAAEVRLQTPSIVVRRSVYEALGAFDTRIKSCGEDWEMWVRIATYYPVAYEPTPLAFYRHTDDSLTKRSVRSGQNIRDMRKAIEITASYLPPHARKANRRSHQTWANWALYWADQMAKAGDYHGAAVQLREAFLCSRSRTTFREAARIVRTTVRRRSAQIPVFIMAARVLKVIARVTPRALARRARRIWRAHDSRRRDANSRLQE